VADLRLIELITPSMFAESLAAVDLDVLSSVGIRYILLDLDNTLLPWNEYNVPEESRLWVEGAKNRGMNICIASNTRNPRRLRLIADGLGVFCIDKVGKPLGGRLRAAVEVMGGSLENTALIGDQVFTDVLGGNRLGMFTVLVKPMHPREFVGTKVSRFFEKLIMPFIKRRVMGTKPGAGKSFMQD
jgi:HAD superfamily phosphatase (TIGR01668 family)